jgi:flagellar hook assembly protein FlgD
MKLNTPSQFTLEQNFPNPFNPETYIRFQLPEIVSVQLVVYNLTGRKIRTLVDSNKSRGSYTVLWDGKDEFDRYVASGIYIYRIKTFGNQKTLTMS